MNRDTLETFAVWGDRQNRDTAHLMDLVIAGCIDHMQGHGTVRLLPARLEEIAERIGPRRRDPDGAWIVTLLPPEGTLAAVNPYDVLAYVHEKRDVREDPELVLMFVQECAKPGVTLRDLAPEYPEFVAWVGARYALAEIDNQPG